MTAPEPSGPVDLVVGRIGKAHGIRGEVSVGLSTDDPEERFAVGAVLRTDPPARGPLTVTTSRLAGGRMVVRFAEIPDRDAAETFRGTLLVVSTADLPPLDDEDDFYDHQLEGLRVETVDGGTVGTVEAVLHGAGADTLAVRRTDGSELLVPFVRAMVPTVDLAAGRVVVDPPEGLLDL